MPAWQASHVDLNSALKSGSRTGGGGEGKGRVRNALIMAEVALALVLLISAGLLIQSFARLGRVQPRRLHQSPQRGRLAQAPRDPGDPLAAHQARAAGSFGDAVKRCR